MNLPYVLILGYRNSYSDGKESACNAGNPVQFLGGEDPLEKERLPTLLFCPGEFYGQKSLAGYSPQGHKESDMTERLTSLSLFTKVLNYMS